MSSPKDRVKEVSPRSEEALKTDSAISASQKASDDANDISSKKEEEENKHIGNKSPQQPSNSNKSSPGRHARQRQWLHFNLDVPADTSGLRPHQAVFNLNGGGVSNPVRTSSPHNPVNGTKEDAVSQKHETSRSNKSTKKETVKTTVDVVKIQLASVPSTSPPPSPNPGETTSATPVGTKKISQAQTAAGSIPAAPLLLYNADRSVKTFIHPGSEGYEVIRQIILQHGVRGMLGAGGGMKGYFYGRIVQQPRLSASIDRGDGNKTSLNPPMRTGGRVGFVSVDCSTVAPCQAW